MNIKPELSMSRDKITFRSVLRTVVQYFFRLLALLAIVLYGLAMSNVWPYEDSSIPDKIHYTIWLVVILSLFDSTDLRKILDYCKKRKAAEPPIRSRTEAAETVRSTET